MNKANQLVEQLLSEEVSRESFKGKGEERYYKIGDVYLCGKEVYTITKEEYYSAKKEYKG